MNGPRNNLDAMTSIQGRNSTRRRPRPALKWDASHRNKAPKLLHVLEERTGPDGELVQVTRGDMIVEYLRTNVPITAAAAAAGCPPANLYDWLRTGAEAQAKQTARVHGQGYKGRLTNVEKVCLEFKQRCDAAIAEGHIRAAGALTRLAEGGIEEVVRTEKVAIDKQGHERVVEFSERRGTLAPNIAALNTLLSRRWPESWAPNVNETVASAGGGVRVSVGELAEVIDGLHEKISRRQQALAAITGPGDDDIVEAEVVEEEPPPALTWFDQPSEQEHDHADERAD